MRSKTPPLRTITPDGKYASVVVARLINYVMKDGKQSVAKKQVYRALELAAAETKQKPLELLDSVLSAVTPQMEVRSRRVGGAAYQVPMPVRPRRSQALALRWLVQESNKRPNKQFHTFGEKLAAEMLDALGNTGGAINRKQTAHRMAEANKAFAHFRW
ncbi:MAG: 30S ribosomal protein S7 [Candidatus Pacebacteria bacterium RIFCSPHIGHO2_01_FULL_46_16]|nr:MAG: 30S ribosomal protein S7 [Candidatus Pacebacteria bacterium RIFCSPHIGHO2_01_FULL_46_16]OGJ22025.1 MAG: 30S ribosomal protein S7 [Candidatus Pacebacteria bacterium RIFCSPHIGHO2_02_FULL_46_9]OGJ38232.1 MAG: 30S ribosomal protein S7 [Candidatus Pacebacteria bacterium RIFCSPLOWO2_01_FULL_47_12]